MLKTDPMSSKPMDFAKAPFLVLWELTRACALACRHCRANAINKRERAELLESEISNVLDQLEQLGHPLIVLTGGDPFERPDLFEIVKKCKNRKFKVALTPSATPRVNERAVQDLAHAGLDRLAISLDGASASCHDSFRGVEGSFEQTLKIIKWARNSAIPVQINTSVSKSNLSSFDSMHVLVSQSEICLWSVFFLVTTGRASAELQISAEEAETILHRMAILALRSEFDIKSTAAPHFRRVLLQTVFAENEAHKQVQVQAELSETSHKEITAISPQARLGALRSYQSVNDGKGILFISHTGDVYPSGFLPIAAGNVRQNSLAEIYRNSELFKSLRRPDLLKGKCGRCRYKAICGGSRARAYAESGDYLSQDNLCLYDEVSES